MESKIERLCDVTFPAFSGMRIMMMPFVIGEPDTVPAAYRALVRSVEPSAQAGRTAYLTIDERDIPAGQTHRRPGRHVDGHGSWGGGGGPWSARGMVLAASELGCVAWPGTFDGEPGPDGECDHLPVSGEPVPLLANTAYLCSPMMVHEALPFATATRRQFFRLSHPNTAPWFEGYTPSPVGVMPTGPIMPRRVEQMSYAP